MAKNIRAKMPEGDSMVVFDVNKEALERFAKEAQPSGVKIAKSPKEVADSSVSFEGFLPRYEMMSPLFYL